MNQENYSVLIIEDEQPARELLIEFLLHRPELKLDGIAKNGDEALKKLSENDYDIIFLDCPPNISLLSENIFNAADILLIPVIPTPLSILAYEKLIKLLKNNRVANLKIHAFFSMVEKRKKIHDTTVRKFLKSDNNFLKSNIPYAADVGKMGIVRKPLLKFRPRSQAAKAYRALWKELQNRDRKK